MRNGNISNILQIIFATLFCSYPTYEEWKPRIETAYFFTSFYSSYPTYEEWKQQIIVLIQNGKTYVLILPMRNGNKFDIANDDWVISCSYPTYEEWKP